MLFVNLLSFALSSPIFLSLAGMHAYTHNMRHVTNTGYVCEILNGMQIRLRMYKINF